MSARQFRLITPSPLADQLRRRRLQKALTHLAAQAGANLTIEPPDQPDRAAAAGMTSVGEVPIAYREQPLGRLLFDTAAVDEGLERTVHSFTDLLEHMVEREMAISDLAGALMTNYEEMNLLYTLLPAITTKVSPHEIGKVLVDEAAHTLGCRRVSLLVLDEKREAYTVLAGCGLPNDVYGLSLPLKGSVASQVLQDEDLLVVNDVTDRPDLAERSRGAYASNSFAVVRVPLQARGEPLGFLTATERVRSPEFTARDRKLLEGLSALGASALMNCRLHAAVNKQMMSTIHALASAVDAKDHYTHDHAGRVAQLCVATARELGIIEATECREIELAGLLHDIGKIGVPDAILSKPAALSPQEYKVIQTHTRIGAGIVEHVPGLEKVALAILHHHERFDGLGYPAGLCGEAIPIASTLIAVADAFDALTSDRPYRKAGSINDALAELERNAGSQLHPGVVGAFHRVIRREQDRSRELRGVDAERNPLLVPQAKRASV